MKKFLKKILATKEPSIERFRELKKLVDARHEKFNALGSKPDELKVASELAVNTAARTLTPEDIAKAIQAQRDFADAQGYLEILQKFSPTFGEFLEGQDARQILFEATQSYSNKLAAELDRLIDSEKARLLELGFEPGEENAAFRPLRSKIAKLKQALADLENETKDIATLWNQISSSIEID